MMRGLVQIPHDTDTYGWTLAPFTFAPSFPAPAVVPLPSTPEPTRRPSKAPTEPPTEPPTERPTKRPTKAPTKRPTTAPPTSSPTSKAPTPAPTASPVAPSTSAPVTATLAPVPKTTSPVFWIPEQSPSSSTIAPAPPTTTGNTPSPLSTPTTPDATQAPAVAAPSSGGTAPTSTTSAPVSPTITSPVPTATQAPQAPVVLPTNSAPTATQAPVAVPTHSQPTGPQAPVVLPTHSQPTGPQAPVVLPAPTAPTAPQAPPEPTGANLPTPTTPTNSAPSPDSSESACANPNHHLGKLVWSDEFDHNRHSGRPNPNVWSHEVGGGGWGNYELQVYTNSTDNVRVQDHALKIIARKETNGGQTVFTTGRITTAHKVSFTYGTLEARIQNPDMDAGLWPAFWTLGSEYYQVGWPFAGEIDIMEQGQGLAIDQGLVNHRVVSAAHWDIMGDYATYARWYDSPVDLTQDFHIYRLEWNPNSISTYVDGNWIWEMDISPSKCPTCQVFHEPHHILLNLAVGGGFTSGGTSSSAAGSSSSSSCMGSSSSSAAGSSSSGGCPSREPEDITAPLPAEMVVDWIRLYDNCHTVLDAASTPPSPTFSPTRKPTSAPTASPTTTAPTQSGVAVGRTSFTREGGDSDTGMDNFLPIDYTYDETGMEATDGEVERSQQSAALLAQKDTDISDSASSTTARPGRCLVVTVLLLGLGVSVGVR